jgi:TolB-like protein
MFEQESDPPAGSVTEHAAPNTDGAAPERSKKRKKKDKVRAAWIAFVGRILAQVLGAAVAIGLAVMVAGRVKNSDASARTAPPSTAATRAERPTPRQVANALEGKAFVAVLPFETFADGPSQDAFADGLTEALISKLAKIRGLHVVSRTSSKHYRDDRKPLPDIAGELGVGVVVEGSVTRAGDRVRITVQVIDATTDSHLWAESYDRSLRDVLAVQAQVTTAIAREIGALLSPTDGLPLTEQRPVDAISLKPY